MKGTDIITPQPHWQIAIQYTVVQCLPDEGWMNAPGMWTDVYVYLGGLIFDLKKSVPLALFLLWHKAGIQNMLSGRSRLCDISGIISLNCYF